MCSENRTSGWYGNVPMFSVTYAPPDSEAEKLRIQLQNAEAEIRELKQAVKSLQAASMYGRKLK